MQITPFEIKVGEEYLDDLNRRLLHTRWPDAIPGMDWTDGTDLAFLQRLANYWRDRKGSQAQVGGDRGQPIRGGQRDQVLDRVNNMPLVWPSW